MRYIFLAIGVVAASVVWTQKASETGEIKRQLAQVPGYTIMPD